MRMRKKSYRRVSTPCCRMWPLSVRWKAMTSAPAGCILSRRARRHGRWPMLRYPALVGASGAALSSQNTATAGDRWRALHALRAGIPFRMKAPAGERGRRLRLCAISARRIRSCFCSPAGAVPCLKSRWYRCLNCRTSQVSFLPAGRILSRSIPFASGCLP